MVIAPVAVAEAPIEEFRKGTQSAQTVLTPQTSILSEDIPHRTVVREESEYRAMSDRIARQKGISGHVLASVIDCESSFNPNAVGDGGKSFGLAQIHLPSWGGKITKSQALNPEWAITFMADQLAEGNGHLWTCYRDLY